MIPAAGRPQVLMLRDLAEVRRLYREMAVSPSGIDLMERKALFRVLRVKGLDARAACVLKEEMLGRGGEVATSYDVYQRTGEQSDCLVMGTLAQFDRVLPQLRDHSFGLAELAEAMAAALRQADEQAPVTHPGLDLRRRPLIMGILNVTPDSFSDAGDFFGADAAIEGARRMVTEGAALIDVGGESTRPGSARVSVDEELRRVLPVVQALAGHVPAHVSVDTYKAEVAARALEEGAFMINDVSALRMDAALVDVLRDADCPVVLMHMQGEPRTMQENPVYEDVVADIYGFFVERLNWAVDHGLKEENLLVDPGIGFGKTLQHNLEILRHVESFRSLGRPVVLGASRKRFLGDILGLPEPKDRMVGTVATTVLAAEKGIEIIRVHDVRENVEAARVARAVQAAGA